jgi:hypothetical protein
MIPCFKNKNKQLEEKVAPSDLISVTYGDFIVEQALSNISCRNF